MQNLQNATLIAFLPFYGLVIEYLTSGIDDSKYTAVKNNVQIFCKNLPIICT